MGRSTGWTFAAMALWCLGCSDTAQVVSQQNGAGAGGAAGESVAGQGGVAGGGAGGTAGLDDSVAGGAAGAFVAGQGGVAASGMGGAAGLGGSVAGGAAGTGTDPFAHCGSRRPYSSCSVQDTCTHVTVPCGAVGSLLDADGCATVSCTQDAQCTPGQRCLPAHLQTSFCVPSVEGCGVEHGQCACIPTADCAGIVSCMPEAQAPRAGDCDLSRDDCGGLDERRYGLTIELATPDLASDLASTIQACLDAIAAASTAQGCLL